MFREMAGRWREFFYDDVFWIATGGALGSVGASGSPGSSPALGETFPWEPSSSMSRLLAIGVIGALVSPEGRMDSPSRTFATQFLMYGVSAATRPFPRSALQR